MGVDEGRRAEDVFRRLFEARFRPLATVNPSEEDGEGLEEKSDGDMEEWTGFSDEEEEEEDGVEVIEYDEKVKGADDRLARKEVRAFMVSEYENFVFWVVIMRMLTHANIIVVQASAFKPGVNWCVARVCKPQCTLSCGG